MLIFRMRSWSSLAVAFVLAVVAVGIDSAHGAVTVAPFANTALDGNAVLGTPYNRLSRTLQMVFSSAQIAATGITSGDSITGLAFRMDVAATGTVPSANRTFTNYNIQLATSLSAPGSLDETFANNVGGDAVTVYNSSLVLSTGSLSTAGSPSPFGPVIVFSTPYVYTGADLLITIRHTGNGSEDIATDAVNNVAGSFQTQTTTSNTGASSTPADASISNRTPVIQLTFSPPIPEPASIALVGLLALGLLRRHSR